jgi:hypothetical protein
LDQYEEIDFISSFEGRFEVTPVVPRDPNILSDSLPAYMPDTVDLAEFLNREELFPRGDDLRIKVLDFGAGT